MYYYSLLRPNECPTDRYVNKSRLMFGVNSWILQMISQWLFQNVCPATENLVLASFSVRFLTITY